LAVERRDNHQPGNGKAGTREARREASLVQTKVSAEQALKLCKAFQRLTDEQLRAIAALCSREVREAGDTFFRAGDNAGHLYVLEEGRVALQMELPMRQLQLRKRVTVDIASKGELFGWSSMVEPYIYTLSAICLQRATVLVVDASRLSTLLQTDFAMGYEVLSGLMNVVGSRLHDNMQLLVTERSLA